MTLNEMVSRVIDDVKADQVQRGSPSRQIVARFDKQELPNARLESNIDALKDFMKKKVGTRKQTGVSENDITDILLSQMKTS